MTKKLISLLMLLTLCMSTVLFTACSDDDSTTNEEQEELSPEKLLIGMWEADDMTQSTYAYYVFNEDGTGKCSDSKVPQSFTNFEYTFDGKVIRTLDTDYPTTTWYADTVKTLTKDRLVISYLSSYNEVYTESFHKVSSIPLSYKELIVGTWNATDDDAEIKCIVTFNEDGTFVSKEYYDNYGDGSYSSYAGTFEGTYDISGGGIIIRPSSDESCLEFHGYIESLTSTAGVLTQSTYGYGDEHLYLSRQ